MNKKKLIIIGAGGFGREVLGYAKDIIAEGNCSWEIEGFIDSDKNALEKYDLDYKVIETIDQHKISDEFVYICAIGNPVIKKDICRSFLAENAQFINLIHPSARIGYTNKIGIGNIFCPNVVLTENVTIENFVSLNCHSDCGHNAKVEDYATISAYCDITGYVTIKEGAFLGSQASICPGVTVGKFSKVGAGACVLQDVPDDTTAVGIPARIVKKT